MSIYLWRVQDLESHLRQKSLWPLEWCKSGQLSVEGIFLNIGGPLVAPPAFLYLKPPQVNYSLEISLWKWTHRMVPWQCQTRSNVNERTKSKMFFSRTNNHLFTAVGVNIVPMRKVVRIEKCGCFHVTQRSRHVMDCRTKFKFSMC